MKEESRAKTGRKPKSDPADYKYSFRLNAGENMRFEKLVTESEAKDKAIFLNLSAESVYPTERTEAPMELSVT